MFLQVRGTGKGSNYNQGHKTTPGLPTTATKGLSILCSWAARSFLIRLKVFESRYERREDRREREGYTVELTPAPVHSFPTSIKTCHSSSLQSHQHPKQLLPNPAIFSITVHSCVSGLVIFVVLLYLLYVSVCLGLCMTVFLSVSLFIYPSLFIIMCLPVCVSRSLSLSPLRNRLLPSSYTRLYFDTWHTTLHLYFDTLWSNMKHLTHLRAHLTRLSVLHN